VHVTLNARNLQGKNQQDLQSSGAEFVAKMTGQLSAVTSNMPTAQEFIDRLNAAHYEACETNIKKRKMRKPRVRKSGINEKKEGRLQVTMA
jgi:hypothetical protein